MESQLPIAIFLAFSLSGLVGYWMLRLSLGLVVFGFNLGAAVILIMQACGCGWVL